MLGLSQPASRSNAFVHTQFSGIGNQWRVRLSSHHTQTQTQDSKMFLFIIHPITCKTRSTDSIFLFLFCVHILVLNMVCAKRIRQICIRADSRTDILWFSKMTKCIKSVFYCLPVVPDIPLSAAHSIPLAVECCFVCVQRLNFPSKTKVSILRSACNFLFVCVCCLKRETNYPPFLPYLNSSSFFSVPQHQHPPTKKKAKTFCEK